MAVAVEEQNLLIGGEWVAAKSGKETEQTNPYTEETVGRAAAAGVDDVDAAVKAAQGAFEAWGFGPPAARRAILSKAADLLMERQEEIAGIVTEETGGVFGWGMFNVQLAAGMLREAAAQAYGLVGEVIPSDVPGKLAMGVRAPAGVVVAIAPWNAPVILATRAVATPLAYANTVVLKASEISPRTHAAVVRALQDAGLPPGVINLITNDPTDAADVVDELIAHPATRRINFTGSTKVGRIIAETAGRHLKRVLLELGARRRSSCFPTPTSTGRPPPRASARSSTRDRSAWRPSASSLSGRDRGCAGAEAASALPIGDPREPRRRSARSSTRRRSSACPGSSAMRGRRGRRSSRRRGAGPVLPADRAQRRDA